jgi:hypothetical protein
MSCALKFVKVIVALLDKTSFRGTLWKFAYKFQFMPWPPTVAAGSRTTAADFGQKTGRQLAVLNQVRIPLALTKRPTRRICK